jgi:large subunit ribosomal protein L4
MQKLLCNHSEVMEVKVLDINGKETGRKVQLSDSVFAIEPNNHAV